MVELGLWQKDGGIVDMKMYKVMYPIEDMTWKESLKYLINKKIIWIGFIGNVPKFFERHSWTDIISVADFETWTG